MLTEGPIPRFVHGVIEYAAGALLIVAPFVLSFDSGAATAAALILGVLVLTVAATTDGPTSLANQLPLAVHVLLDYALVAVLIALPFVGRLLRRDRPHGVLHHPGRGPPDGDDRDPLPVAQRLSGCGARLINDQAPLLPVGAVLA